VIARIYFVPIQPILLLFIIKETIVLIQDFPQCLEVACGGIVGEAILLANARRAQQEEKEWEKYLDGKSLIHGGHRLTIKLLTQSIFLFDTIEMLHIAYKECVGVVMIPQTAQLRLAIIALIAHTEGVTEERKVDCQQVLKTQCIAKTRGPQVLGTKGIFGEHLIIGLHILG
jgi:hypothetical protein